MNLILKLIVVIGLILFVITNCCHGQDTDFYKLLGISKTATTREIRQAFKKIALEKHPDKNQGDPNANENFIKINRAYEILKDEELRKKYDMYGEKGLHEDMNRGQQYQSWNFYHQNFGIYDEDPEIITLSRSDFMQSVDGANDIWFVNYYSPQCSHCHDLAPVWRELAKQLDGVVRIGAVNCMDDWMLCNEQRIGAFPTIVAYPSRSVYQGERSVEQLLKYALSFTNANVHDISERSYEKIMSKKLNNNYWFISYCLNTNDYDYGDENIDEYNCLDDLILKKLAIILNGLVNIGRINCNYEQALCTKLKPKSPNVFYMNNLSEKLNEIKTDIEQIKIDSNVYKTIASKLLQYVPDVQLLSEEMFQNALNSLKEKGSKPWIIQFVSNYKENSDLEMKKLPVLLNGDIKVGRVDCTKLTSECSKYYITKYPTFVLFKRRSLYEHHYGNRHTANDLALFARDNAFTNLKSMSPSDFPSILQQDRPIFLDFFAPWCPPCMQLLPQFRKASKKSGRLANFGTIDCTVHTSLCEQYNIRSYPTTILFNNTTPHQYHGHHSADELFDFVNDILNPTVYYLTYDKFQELVATKPIGKLWLVDFFASWCGPCQQLAPEWRKLSKKLANIAFVGQVDCVIEQRLCSEQGIQSYPHIRLYPSESAGVSTYEVYNNMMWRDVNSLYQWASNFLPSKTIRLNNNNFESMVLKSNEPWLVDFYAPWCGHCQVFAPTFDSIATKLEGKVKCGKLNCQEFSWLCQQLNIRGYPTIRFYNAKSRSFSSGSEDIDNQDFNYIVNYVSTRIKPRDEF